jgi:hypothetical protein
MISNGQFTELLDHCLSPEAYLEIRPNPLAALVVGSFLFMLSELARSDHK